MIPRWKNDDASGASAETPAGGRKCRPLVFILTTGQAADGPQFIPVLKKVRVRGPVGRPRIRPDAVAGDKAYSSRGNRAHLRKRLIKVGGHPGEEGPGRQLEEGLQGWPTRQLKAWRGIATRYDKTPDSYLADLHLRASMIWIKELTRTIR
ncbi:hypothetical protein M2156_009020 [Streptomyces sp. SAI-149]|nr:hypothetical protein [Streptomyces sp. SAI-149]